MKKFLKINDIDLCFDDTEVGESTVLLIHGITSSKEGMYPIGTC